MSSFSMMTMSSGVRTGAKIFRSMMNRMVNGMNKRKLLIIGAVVCLLIVGLGLTFWKLGAKKPSSSDTSSEALDSSVQGNVSSSEEGATTDPQTGDPVTEPGDVTSRVARARFLQIRRSRNLRHRRRPRTRDRKRPRRRRYRVNPPRQKARRLPLSRRRRTRRMPVNRKAASRMTLSLQKADRR